MKAVFSAHFDGDVSDLVDGIQKIPAEKQFRPFDVGIARFTGVWRRVVLTCVPSQPPLQPRRTS